jgi:hypothetical protein
MDRPATTNPATAREIILEIVRNMREGLEPLHYSTLPPSIYHVYLHPDDMERLRGIIPRIIDEARRALDAELETLNKGSLSERLRIGERLKIPERLRSSRPAVPKVTAPEAGWQIRILENTDDDVQPGDLVIHSELAMPPKAELGAGSMTKRIATRRMGGAETVRQTYEPVAPPSTEPVAAPASPSGTPAESGCAVIEYDESGVRKTFCMVKDQIVVGRGGRDYWTDLKLDTLPDVSREHFRLRRDPATGKFFLKDLSRLGTTINGEKAPSSIEFVAGEKQDRNVEAPVPDQARIGLAGVVFLDFRSTSNG